MTHFLALQKLTIGSFLHLYWYSLFPTDAIVLTISWLLQGGFIYFVLYSSIFFCQTPSSYLFLRYTPTLYIQSFLLPSPTPSDKSVSRQGGIPLKSSSFSSAISFFIWSLLSWFSVNALLS